MTRGWWRRNRWGVLLIVPAIALGLAQPVQNQWHRFWVAEPRTTVSARLGGWATVSEASMRLDTLTAATGFTNDFGAPASLPAGVSVWRASMTFRSTHPERLAGCKVEAVDASGNAYDFGPAELGEAGIYTGDESCVPDLNASTMPPSWSDVEYFVLPTGVTPTAVRVQVDDAIPAYVLLSR